MTATCQTGPSPEYALKILVVDDDPKYRFLLKDEIHELDQHVEILEADSGEGALAFFPECAIQIMVLDYEMPGINGAQVLRKLKDQGISKIAIGLTRYDEPVLSEMRASCAVAAFCKDKRQDFLDFLKRRIVMLTAS